MVEQTWQIPDGQIRPPNDRVYLVKIAGGIRVVYWLDSFEREVFITRVENSGAERNDR